ncbi:hypothetical protein HJD18_06075 [Thermoleophilia bacterium SCSIO 60948]|nr:hypothetical protein HJD18_06075 [Thermoleophilia bacterium SCSIO 60948]
MGGAVFNHQGTVRISNSTLAANSAEGGSTWRGGTAGQGLGGAIFNLNGEVDVSFATVAGNSAPDGGAGIYNLGYMGVDTGAGGHAYIATADIDSSIVHDAASQDVASNAPTTVANGAGNTAPSRVDFGGSDIVQSVAAVGTGTTTGAPMAADPQLSPLAANGGDTFTMAIGGASPAFNAAGATCAPATDQRATPRPQFGACDVGAFELGTSSTISVLRSGSGAGSVTSDPVGIDCGATCSADYPSGQSVALTATPEPGSVFDHWDGACTGVEATCTVMADDLNVTAVFADVTPPDTKVTKTVVNDKRRTATFRFASTEPGSTFTCKLDGHPARPCTSPRTYANLKVGRHRLKVTAADGAGNADPTPASKRWRIRPRR